MFDSILVPTGSGRSGDQDDKAYARYQARRRGQTMLCLRCSHKHRDALVACGGVSNSIQVGDEAQVRD